MSAPVLISAAQVVLNNLIPLASEQMKVPLGFKEDLKTLRRRLTLIQALLRDAENRRITAEIMCEWLKNLKLVTCDAENVLDEIAYETLRRKLEVQNRKSNKGLLQGVPVFFHVTYLLDQLQRLIALKVLSIEDFDGLEALPECLGNLSSLSFFEASELQESDVSSYAESNATPHQFMIVAYL